jgi:hypothetical protein
MAISLLLPNTSLYALNALKVRLTEEAITQREEYKMTWQYADIGTEKGNKLM